MSSTMSDSYGSSGFLLILKLLKLDKHCYIMISKLQVILLIAFHEWTKHAKWTTVLYVNRLILKISCPTSLIPMNRLPTF